MHAFIIEFLGTCFLMFIIIATKNFLAIGSALALIVFLSQGLSAGAFNPAVTIGLYEGGLLPNSQVFGYIIAQIAGALAAVELKKRVKF